MKTASKLLIASTTSVLLATAAASSGSGAVQTVTTTKAHPGHSAHGVTPSDPQAKKFVKGVSVPEITEHQVALQQIASLNNDTREVFSSGYQESLDYVVSTLRAAGYQPKVDQFNFPFWAETQPPVLNMVAPTPKTYVPGDAEDSDLPTRRLHHHGQLADRGAHQRSRVPRRRHRRPAHGRLDQRLRGG